MRDEPDNRDLPTRTQVLVCFAATVAAWVLLGALVWAGCWVVGGAGWR